MSYLDNIRNFSIIAHIDHGKSTLADRLIEKTGLVEARDMKEQYLDNMDIERERGITIKLQTTRLKYQAKDGQEYILNLIDTPGHVDFNYEVSRSLAACDGAVLVVDATQGVEAQTLGNVYLALDEDLEIMPVLNKMDLDSARPADARAEIEDIIGLDASEAPEISAKTGMGIDEMLEKLVEVIPPPKGNPDGKLKALIFDSYYDSYKGVIIYTRIFDGRVRKGDVIRMMNTGKNYEVTEVGYCIPGTVPSDELKAGEVGYICGSIKQVEISSCGLNGSPLRAEGRYPATIACHITNGHMPHGSNRIFEDSFPNYTNDGEERFIGEISDGTLIGFITGIYLPIGSTDKSIQYIIEFFPVSHAASIFRKILMEDPIKESFRKIPEGGGVRADAVNEFRLDMGVDFNISNHDVTTLESILYLVAAALVFYTIGIIITGRKNRG